MKKLYTYLSIFLIFSTKNNPTYTSKKSMSISSFILMRIAQHTINQNNPLRVRTDYQPIYYHNHPRNEASQKPIFQLPKNRK